MIDYIKLAERVGYTGAKTPDELHNLGVHFFEREFGVSLNLFGSAKRDIPLEVAIEKVIQLGLARNKDEAAEVLDSLDGQEVRMRGGGICKMTGFDIIKTSTRSGQIHYRIIATEPD